jgi:DNA ligase D
VAEPRVPVVVAGREILISSPRRVVLPGITKLQLASYYAAVADRLFAALVDRPTTLERWPDGVQPGMSLGNGGFYAKRLPKGSPDWIEGVEITFPSGRRAVELCPTEPAVAVWAAQMGTITFHPWPVRQPNVDHPDQMRLDFDPQPGRDFVAAARAALNAKVILDELGLTGFVKTSGGRGVHVFVPLQPRWDFVQVRHAVIALARELQRRHPAEITTAWWKEERGQRVFVDFNQAARDRTMASAYSVRATASAAVSMPVSWAQLADVRPENFTIPSVMELVESGQVDPWARMGDDAGDISELLKWWERDVAAGEGELPYPPDYPKMPGEPARVAPSRARRSAKD